MKHKIDEYDKQNGTELARFVAYLERGKYSNRMKAGIFTLQMPENYFPNMELRELSQQVRKLSIDGTRKILII